MELDCVGVSHAEQRLYEVVLHHPDRTLAQLGELTNLGAARLRELLRSLADKGLLARTGHRPARFAPAPPDIAIEVLALRRQQEIETARLAGAAFRNRLRHNGFAVAESPVEVVRGQATVAQRFGQIQQVARQELLILNKPPYVVDPGGERHVPRRGVRHRTIHDRGAVEHVARPRRPAVSGEEARVLDDVPMTLVIADRRIALAPCERPGGDRTAVLLRSSALLDGLVMLFETLWEQATPLWPHHRFPPGPDARALDALSTGDRQLLALLAAGLTDQAIARKLGVALRTVERRVRRIMDGFGARTRFQAGLQAAARGVFHAGPDPQDPDTVTPGGP
jgi:sugar-specific transcriptional regulator TrmB/DNA-binding CsgD family transcriptional regulator